MAVGKCGDCKGKVSTNAAVCPHCGAPVDGGDVEKRAQRDKRTIWAAVIVVGLLLVAWIGASNNSSPTADSQASADQPTASDKSSDVWADKRAQVENRADLGIKPDQFTKRYNAALADLNQAVRIAPNIKRGQQAANTFSAEVYSSAILTGTMKQSSDKLTSVTLIGAGDGSANSGARILLAAVALFMASSEQMSKKSAADLVMKLTGQRTDHKSAEQVIDGIRYSCTKTQSVGVWFGIEPAKNSE